MPNGEYTRFASEREFDDFREEVRGTFKDVRDEIRWVRNFLIGILVAIIGSNIAGAFLWQRAGTV